MNWEYDGYEQHLVTTKGRIEPGGQYKDNGEWKMVDSSGCVQIQNTDEGLWYSVKVIKSTDYWYLKESFTISIHFIVYDCFDVFCSKLLLSGTEILNYY